jgi:hypothetical protein
MPEHGILSVLARNVIPKLRQKVPSMAPSDPVTAQHSLKAVLFSQVDGLLEVSIFASTGDIRVACGTSDRIERHFQHCFCQPHISLKLTHSLIRKYLLYLIIVVRIDVSPDLLCALVLVTRRLA